MQCVTQTDRRKFSRAVASHVFSITVEAVVSAVQHADVGYTTLRSRILRRSLRLRKQWILGGLMKKPQHPASLFVN
jgi:hypothetical protein